MIHALRAFVIGRRSRVFILIPITYNLNPFLSNRLRPSFTRADANTLFKRRDENLSIADFTRTSALDDGINARLYEFIIHSNLQTNFLEQINFSNNATETLIVTLLLAATKNVSDRHLVDLVLV